MCSKGKASGQFFNKYVEPGIDKATYSLKPIGQYMKVFFIDLGNWEIRTAV